MLNGLLRTLILLPLLMVGLQEETGYQIEPDNPVAGTLVRVRAKGPGEAVVKMPDRTLRLKIHKSGFSFLPLKPGKVSIQFGGKSTEIVVGEPVPPAPIPPGQLSRADQQRVMTGIEDAWAEGDIDRIIELQQHLQRFKPPNNARDVSRFREFSVDFMSGIGSVTDRRAFEAKHCIRCHLHFRWGVVRDISKYPELRDE